MPLFSKSCKGFLPRTLDRLTLTDFRSYAALRFEPQARRLVFAGPNGAGKTNLLEAVSLLVPGRGLRGARFAELARRGGAGRLGRGGAVCDNGLEIGTGAVDGAPERREFRLNGVKPRAQSEVAEQFAAVWLTPQMDRLFTETASGRRKFLDRLVVALEPFHAREIAAFESASAQRNRLLAEPPYDAAWAGGAGGCDGPARRGGHGGAGGAACAAERHAGGGCCGPVSARGAGAWLRHRGKGCSRRRQWMWRIGCAAALAAARAADAVVKSARPGPQKADLLITDATAGRPAALSSTGQQKAMLIGIVLGHAAMISGRARRGAAAAAG